MKEIEIQGHRYTVAEYNAEFQIDSGGRMLRLFVQEHPDVAELTNTELQKRFDAWQKGTKTMPSADMRRLERDMLFEPVGDAPPLSVLMRSKPFTIEEIGTIMQEQAFFTAAASASSPELDFSTTPSKSKSAQRSGLAKGKASRSPRKTIKGTRS